MGKKKGSGFGKQRSRNSKTCKNVTRETDEYSGESLPCRPRPRPSGGFNGGEDQGKYCDVKRYIV